MKKFLLTFLIGGLILASAGCGSKPSAEELKQLEDLKAEVSSLERDIAARESDKASLVKSIADKDAQLSQCAKDKEAVDRAMKGLK